MENNKITNLMWTGGWDSTFRLLDLLLVKKQPVQPHYIIDPNRLSIHSELRAMQQIKKLLFAQFPGTIDLLRPTQYKNIDDITPNKEITESFEKVCARIHIGGQYEWLARYVREIGIDNMEISIERGPLRIISILSPIIIKIQSSRDPFYVIDKKHEGTPEYTLFHHFRFPIIDITKSEMEAIAKRNNFFNLMRLTFFCHRPLANGTPCGACHPCVVAVEAGYIHRLPFNSRVRYYLHKGLKKILAPFPTLYRFAQTMKLASSYGKKAQTLSPVKNITSEKSGKKHGDGKRNKCTDRIY